MLVQVPSANDRAIRISPLVPPTGTAVVSISPVPSMEAIRSLNSVPELATGVQVSCAVAVAPSGDVYVN